MKKFTPIIEKVEKFYYMGEVYYHKTNFLTGEFISESNGFYSDKRSRLNEMSEIIDTWFNVQFSKVTVPFFPSSDEAISFSKSI